MSLKDWAPDDDAPAFYGTKRDANVRRLSEDYTPVVQPRTLRGLLKALRRWWRSEP